MASRSNTTARKPSIATKQHQKSRSSPFVAADDDLQFTYAPDAYQQHGASDSGHASENDNDAAHEDESESDIIYRRPVELQDGPPDAGGRFPKVRGQAQPNSIAPHTRPRGPRIRDREHYGREEELVNSRHSTMGLVGRSVGSLITASLAWAGSIISFGLRSLRYLFICWVAYIACFYAIDVLCPIPGSSQVLQNCKYPAQSGIKQFSDLERAQTRLSGIQAWNTENGAWLSKLTTLRLTVGETGALVGYSDLPSK